MFPRMVLSFCSSSSEIMTTWPVHSDDTSYRHDSAMMRHVQINLFLQPGGTQDCAHSLFTFVPKLLQHRGKVFLHLQDSGWIFALLHRVGCNSAVILHMFEGCEWLAGGTSREEGSGAHFCATLWSITTAGILLARRQHVQTDFSTQSLLPPVQSFLRVINWNSFCFEEKKLILLVERFSLLPRNRIGRWNPMSKTCSGQAHKWCST